jgi:polysaccharide deacetylase 2 family uncharacterized protein YibQ
MRDFLFAIIVAGLIFGAAHSLFQHNRLKTNNGLMWHVAEITKEEIVQPPTTAEKPEKEKPPETAAPYTGPRTTITIIIDDVGVDVKRSARTIKLPKNVTLAFLPYAPKVREQVARAHDKGHEIMVHLPMQPEGTIDPGPDYLGTDIAPEEIARRVQVNLNAFDGYVAVNNHMGSQFTQDRERLMILMAALRAKGVMFIDSKTAPKSIAEQVAREFGIPANHRDVFIDHVEDSNYVTQQLIKVEQISRKYGNAIAIGHPKDVTLNALERWLPGLKARGFDLVPVTQTIRARAK